uniref:(northern house mosquito) hypothetical protein n=1 Tax=Culex pipiens TaxID=7175 RepID=A0A8D8D3S0_CULPI
MLASAEVVALAPVAPACPAGTDWWKNTLTSSGWRTPSVARGRSSGPPRAQPRFHCWNRSPDPLRFSDPTCEKSSADSMRFPGFGAASRFSAEWTQFRRWGVPASHRPAATRPRRAFPSRR